MSKPSLVIVLAEDARQQRFVRKFLREKGIGNHQIRLEPLPGGRGCGEQWVRERYPNAVRAYRARTAGGKAKSALVVVIDADTEPTERRQGQLREMLIQSQLFERVKGEAIVHLIPKRNIETWVLFLNDRKVDEQTDYKQTPGVDELIGDAARIFQALTSGARSVGLECVPSLVLGISEASRL